MAKVLDFTRLEQTADAVGRPRELVVRCDGFRVTLPTSGAGGNLENPFERVVCRLLGLRRYDAEELAAETCLPGDLVRFILLRLVDKGYVDERQELLDAGRAALGRLQQTEAAAVGYSTHLVFRERISDMLLPMLVSTNDLPVRESQGSVRLAVYVGTKTIYPKALGCRSGSSTAPTALQVAAVLARMSQRARILGNSGPTRALGHGILITAEPEPYLLRCHQVVQRFDSDWRITDPFGQGYSVDLERAYRDLLDLDDSEAAAFHGWQKQISDQAPPRPAPGAGAFGDARNNERYPELVRSLQRKEWYGALEWALFYLNQNHDLTQSLQLAKVRTSPQNEAAVLATAQDLGFTVDAGLLRGLVDLRNGRISAFLKGSAAMAAVLPLALLSASQNPGHPLLGLAKEMPELVEVISYLKNQRGDELHHKTSAPKGDGPLPSPLASWTQNVVQILLPTLRFDGDRENAPPPSGSVDDRLDARLELQSQFSRTAFAGWPTELQDNLLDAEFAWLTLTDDEPPDASTFVNRLATATQSAFRYAIDRTPPGTQVDGDYATFAAERTSQHGLGPLPERLRTVPHLNVEKSLNGGQGTLGSVIVAYLVRADDMDLTRLERHKRTLLADLDRLIKLRGHGNRRLDTDRRDCSSLRRGIYTTIRSLLET